MLFALFDVYLHSNPCTLAMKHTLIFVLLLIFYTIDVNAHNQNLEQFYAQLDDAIANSHVYVAQHEREINALRTSFNKARSDKDKYAFSYKLFQKYKSYMNDSALSYLNRCIVIANKIHRNDLSGYCKSLLAFQCSTSGMYTEALDVLGSISMGDLDNAGLCRYYFAYIHVYGELNYYTKLNDLKDKYQKLANNYKQSLYKIIDKNSEDYLLLKENDMRNQKRYAEALAYNNKRLAKIKPGSREYAIIAFYRYLIYAVQNNKNISEYWLLQSAINDTRHAVMDQASMWILADVLNSEGDLNRSYKYIRFTWDCNKFFNTRMRSWQISPMLSLIDSNYQKQIRNTNRKLTTFVVVISVLSVLLLALLFFFYAQKKKLSIARNELKRINGKLAKLNDNLSVVNENLDVSNQRLSSANSKLSMANERLNESNRVKEEYIGRFLSLCSQYVNKLDDYRKMVNKKMKNKELDELFQISRSTEFKEKELEELYHNFDTVFLHLFPNFVNDFNAMLKPEFQIHPKLNDQLTTDIRIFALIRLGIDDSSKIAEFLHYSVNTIYNYRARIKNGALVDRDDFEKRVKELGLNT